MAAAAPPAAHRRARLSRAGSPRRCNTARGSVPLCCICCTLLPEKRLARLMAYRVGVTLVAATIARISRDCAMRYAGFVDVVRDLVAAAAVKHLDETRFRVGGRAPVPHIRSTPV